MRQNTRRERLKKKKRKRCEDKECEREVKQTAIKRSSVVNSAAMASPRWTVPGGGRRRGVGTATWTASEPPMRTKSELQRCRHGAHARLLKHTLETQRFSSSTPGWLMSWISHSFFSLKGDICCYKSLAAATQVGVG
jgi:hypothetical protein